ncbi:MAG: ATP-binding protein [Chloroflexi bacterium]|nr:ATP-binding protein [Chloroflexota bacterium]
MESVSLKIAPSLDQLERITAVVEDLGERDDWPADLIFKVNLVLDELWVNVVHYSGATGDVEVSLDADADEVRLEIADDGRPFDPLSEAVEPDLDAALEERPIGGLGIFLVREMMDELHYRREDGKNRLAMVKRKGG